MMFRSSIKSPLMFIFILFQVSFAHANTNLTIFYTTDTMGEIKPKIL